MNLIHCRPPFTFLALAFLILVPGANAQLTDETQTTPNVPGGAIAKSLAEQVGTGQGDEFTPGSSIYLINRDPARSVRRGRQLFQRKFTVNQGSGPRVSGNASGNIRNNRALGAGLVDSCAGCHGRPRGAAGFGGDVVTRPDSRDAPHLFGLGLKEMLADEMTTQLRATEAQAIQQAQGSGHPVTRNLFAKGIYFGRITGLPDGTSDISRVEGVDTNLRVKPFFFQGGTVTMREFAIGAFKAEMGLESPDPILCDVTDPVNPQARTSPAGFHYDPATDTYERPPVCDANVDGDGDGIVNEVDPALVDHMEFYLLNYFKPGLDRQTYRTQQGLALMHQIGCTNCHVQNLTIDNDRRVADVTTVYDPRNGIFNRLFATAQTLFTVVDDGEEFPKLVPQGNSFVVRNIFTDFKRHDLGETYHEREYDGTFQTEFLTTPLWGVGTSAPYGHDGRSITLRNAILRHGGEAAFASRNFNYLSDNNERKILEFLQSLVLFPPDDTASNLNPGGGGSGHIQDPATHGSINLGALFQIPSEGPE